MRSAFICLTLAIVFSTVFSQRPIVRYSENLKKAVPHHYNHDQKNTDRSLDKIARGHKIEPPLPPLRAHSEVPWLRWVQEGRWAAQADKNSELHKVRARLLEEKLKPNNFAFRPQINPQLKPKLKRKENVRHKREAMMPQVPEVIMQPDNEVKLSQPHEQMQRKTEGLEKRDKRQILYFINKPPKLLARSPRTTPNPFIRDTHIEDYDIIRPEVGEREGMIPTIEAGSSDLGSYPLVTFQKVIRDLTKRLLNLRSLITGKRDGEMLYLENKLREKRSPKMSKLKKKQKIEKKKRKKKKQKELTPRQIKHIRRKKEKKERRKKLHDKKLKEKRRLRHKKLGTGPYNKTITDYYGVYYDPPSSQLNESLYDSIYDTSEIDSDALYEERMKERYDDYPESESEDSDAYYDEQIYGDTKESSDGTREKDNKEAKSSLGKDRNNEAQSGKVEKNIKESTKLHTNKATLSHSSRKEKNTSIEKDTKGSKKEE